MLFKYLNILKLIIMSTQSQSKSDGDTGKVESGIHTIREPKPAFKNTLAGRFENAARKSDFIVLLVIFITSLGYVSLLISYLDLHFWHDLWYKTRSL